MRRLRAANPEPTRPPEGDELFERLVAQPGDGRLASPSRDDRRPHGRRRLTLRRSAALATAAAAVAAIVLVATHAGSATPGSGRQNGYATVDPQAASVLGRLAADAAGVAPFTERYVTLAQSDTFSNLPGEAVRMTSIVAVRSGAGSDYAAGVDLRGRSAASRAALRRDVQGGVDALIDPEPLLYTAAWYRAFPNDPAALRAQLMPIGAFLLSIQFGLRPTVQPIRALLHHRPLPASAVPRSAQVRADDVYAAATDLLTSPLVSPALRGALYSVLSSTPGVSVTLHARDPSGRPAVEMSRRVEEQGARLLSTTWEDPTTGAVLAQRAIVHGPHVPVAGESTATYEPVTLSNRSPADPYSR